MMVSSSDSDGQSTRRALSGWLWRVAVAMICPPLVTLAVFFTGLAVNHVRTDYAQIRFLVTLLLCGPLAPAAGFASAVKLSFTLLGSRDPGRRLAVAVILVNLVTVCFVWSRAFFRFHGLGWG